MISNLKPRTQLMIAIFLPICCIGLAALLVIPYVLNLRKLQKELETTKQTIQQKRKLITQAESIAGGRSLDIAVAIPDEQEPILFLRNLAELSKASNITLASVRDTAPPPLARTSQRSGGSLNAPSPRSTAATSTALRGERPDVPPSVQELTNQVTAEGTFRELLGMIVRLENFDRILSVSQCRITTGSGAKYPRLQAVFTLSRFVGNPAAVAVSPTAQPGAAPTSSTCQPKAGY